MKILIRGAGDIATGIALRLYRAGMQVVMTDLPAPTAIRRTVCFSQAIILGEMTVEDVTARRAGTPVFFMLGASELPLRQGFACGKTLVRRKSAAPPCGAPVLSGIYTLRTRHKELPV